MFSTPDAQERVSTAAIKIEGLITLSHGHVITLTVPGYKVKGTQTADLALSGATPNDGAYIDNIDSQGRRTRAYRIGEGHTATCSGDVSVSF